MTKLTILLPFVNDILSMAAYNLVPTRFLQFLMIIHTILHDSVSFSRAKILQMKEMTFIL